ncbi:hypothetical protein FG05_35190 [Fusarium graminearum]|nr:hypothetical protein FG05_35190 [Fusarium graminearum]
MEAEQNRESKQSK